MAAKNDIRAGKAFVELTTKDNLTKGLKAAGARLKSFGLGVARIGAAITAVGAAIKAPMIAMAHAFAESGNALAKMSARTGIAVEALSELRFAADKGGTDIESLETAIKKMQKAISAAAGGAKEAAVPFRQLGISVAELVKLSPDEQFQLIAERLDAIADPTKKAALAMQIFGKAGTSIIPMIHDLAETRREARDLGLVMSSQTAAAAVKLHESFYVLGRVIGGISTAIGSAVAPAMTQINEIITRVVITVRNWIREHKELFAQLFKFASVLIVVGSAVAGLGLSFVIAGTALSGFAAALGVVAGLIGAILSPMGLAVAAIVGGAVAWTQFTESGQNALAALGAALGPFLKTFQDTFRGIADAIMGGNLELAGQIAMKGLHIALLQGWDLIKALWTEGTNRLSVIWQTALNFIADTWGIVWNGVANIWTGIQASIAAGITNFSAFFSTAWENLLYGIQISWRTVWGGIRNFFLKVVGDLLDTLSSFIGAIPGAHEALVAFLDTDERDWKDAAASMRKNAAEYDKGTQKIADSHTSALGQIEANRRGANAIIAGNQDSGSAARQRALDADILARQKALGDMQNAPGDAGSATAIAQAKKELGDLIAQSAKARMEADNIAKGKLPDEHKAVEALAGSKAGVFGSFSAAAALGNAMSGNNDPVVKEIKATDKKADKRNDKLVAAVEKGLVFA